MFRNFKLIWRWLSFPLILAAGLVMANVANAQQPKIITRVLYPPRNYEIYLGDTVTPSVRVWNTDIVSHTGIELYYRISNVVTGIAIYYDSVILPSISPRDSIDTLFPSYATNPNILYELGTFNACLIFGDTSCSRLFGIRRTSTPFRDPSNNYSHTISGDIPDQTLLVSVGATVVDGENSTWDPPPPRNTAGYGPDGLISPVIRLDRKDESGNFYTGDNVGDTLTSFPINMQGKTFVDFMFDFMRGGKFHYPLNWDADTMYGPESTITDSMGLVVRAGDSLILEFKKPSEPATNPSPNGWNEIAAIDGGQDFEFKSLDAYLWDTTSITVTVDGITKKMTNTPNYFTSDFRFRLRLKAKNDAPSSSQLVDDADTWYIDNPTWQWPNIPDFEALWVRVVCPYSKAPLSQAVFPVYLNLHDYGFGSIGVFPFPIKVAILDPLDDTVYSQTIQFGFLNDTGDTVIRFPDWDASQQWLNSEKPYSVIVSIDPYVDHYTDDNVTYSKFYLNVDARSGAIQEFAMDEAGINPQPGVGNDIPKLLGVNGKGIGFSGTSGSYAMKFHLARPDTFYGARAYFEYDESPDYIQVSLLNGDSNSCIPLDTVMQPGVASTMFAQIGGNGEFWPYYFPNPIVLQKGTYWIAVSLPGTDIKYLGAGISRGGGEIVSASNTSPQIRAVYGPSSHGMPYYGTQWGSGPADNNGDVSCSFAVETPAGSGMWKPLMPSDGWWPAMNSTDNMWPVLSNTVSLEAAPWTGAGTYTPMIRPIFGNGIPPPSRVTIVPDVQVFALRPTYPNPFDPTASSTTILFTLPEESPASLTICNIMGDVVRTLVNSNESAGSHTILWDGKDSNGVIVPVGAYLISLVFDGRRATAKMIVSE